ncbi:hypothetical protein Aduo_018604 [Ancylostoma duodenale]
MSEGSSANIPELGQSIDHNQIYLACKMLGNRIDKFSGAGEKTFEEFLEEYTDLIQRFSIPHSVAKSLLSLYPTGGAKLRLQQIEDHEKLPWKELVTELAKRFKSQALLSNLRDELHNIVQGKDSVGEFAKKVFSKTKIAFQGQGDRVVSRMAIDFFVKGLNPEIRKAIHRLPDTEDFEVIVCNAEKESRVLEQERREDRDTIQTINALITDEKLSRLEQQLSGTKVTAPRPRMPMIPPRMGNRFRQPSPGRFQNLNFNTNQKPFGGQLTANPPRRFNSNGFRNRPFWNKPRSRFVPRPRTFCNCPASCHQPNMICTNWHNRPQQQ